MSSFPLSTRFSGLVGFSGLPGLGSAVSASPAPVSIVPPPESGVRLRPVLPFQHAEPRGVMDAATLSLLSRDGAITDSATIRKAIGRLQWLEKMGSAEPSANSLHEYVSYEVAAAVVKRRNPQHLDRLFELFSRPYSLADLDELCLNAELESAFRLVELSAAHDLSPDAAAACLHLEGQGLPVNIRSTLRRFIATLDFKGRWRIPSDGLSPQRMASLTHAADVFLRALRNFNWSGLVAGEIQAAPSHRTAFLRLNRLFAVLSSHLSAQTFEDKIEEFRSLPFVNHGYDFGGVLRSASGAELCGTLHTAFVRHPQVASVVRAFWRGASVSLSENQNLRQQRWENAWKASATGALNDDQRLVSLLRTYDDPCARRLAQRIEDEEIEVRFFTPEQMEAYAENKIKLRNNATPTACIEAGYEHPLLGDDARRILILKKYGEPWASARAAREATALALHEGGRHIEELETLGKDWMERNFVASEMTAYLSEVRFRLWAGDEVFFRELCGLSPYGPVLGLRHYVEQLYLRSSDIPAF